MSDMSLSQAADEVRKILRGFKAIEQVSEALEQVGSIQNAGKEATKALEGLKEDIVKAENTLAIVNTQIIQAKDEAKKITVNSKTKADDLISKAEFEAKEIINRAVESANAADETARTTRAAYEVEANKVSAARSELEELEAKIAKVKAQAAKISGS